MSSTRQVREGLGMIIHRMWGRVKYLFELIVQTPKYPLILSLTLLSGFLSFLGIPLLIPILAYMQSGNLDGSGDAVNLLAKFFIHWGIQPSFYLLLSVASILILCGQLLVTLSSLIALYSTYEMVRVYSKQLFDLYLKVDWMWLTGTNSGEINYVVLRESQYAADCHWQAQKIVISLIQCAVYIGLAFFISAQSVLLALMVFGALMLLNFKNADRVRAIAQETNHLFNRMSKTLSGLQQNKKFLKTSQLNHQIVERTMADIEAICRNYKRTGLRSQLQEGWSFSFTFLFLILIILFHQALNMDYTRLLVLALVIQRLSPQFASMASTYTSLNNFIPMQRSLKSRLADMQQHIEKTGTTALKEIEDIRFENVYFNYPQRNTGNSKVIHNLNLTIPARHSIAIVGGSGAGKTTILDMILGLIKPQEGAIYYGGIHHNDIDLFSLRSQIAYISQEPTLMDGTIRENLTIGCPHADERMIQEICRKVHIHHFIQQLPQGLDTRIGENGIQLSGGQRQRVVLGRSLFLKPKMLILDEATSELDSESERMIQDTIRALSKELTIVVVAHRLSTVKFADRVYVMENGTVVESGTYDELLAKKGRLFELDTLQK